MNYCELEERFREKADEERSIYLPRIVPDFPVDFVFVGMEPSLGSWVNARGKENEIKEEAERKIRQGFVDFAFSMGDFILHYCIREYLCRSGASYYITNISKGAMTVNHAAEGRQERYSRWYPLFVEELELASKETTKVITIGKGVKDVLDKKGHKKIYSILHYSQQAVKFRGRHIQDMESQFCEFKKTVCKADVLDVAGCVIRESNMSKELGEKLLARLMKSRLSDLSLSQKKLIFDYKIDLTRLAGTRSGLT